MRLIVRCKQLKEEFKDIHIMHIRTKHFKPEVQEVIARIKEIDSTADITFFNYGDISLSTVNYTRVVD
jgi:hypothetical protein